jgi:hypothetical protein
LAAEDDPPAVAGLRKTAREGVEVLDRDRIGVLGALVLAAKCVVRRQVDLAARSVDDRFLSRNRRVEDALDVRHERDLERPGEDGAVRRRTAVRRHQPRDLLRLEEGEVRRKDRIGHHDRAFGKRDVPVANPEKPRHHAAAHFLDVQSALAEIRIRDPLEGFLVVVQHLADGRECVARGRDAAFELRDEALVLDDLHVDVEDRGKLGTEALAHLLLHVRELDPSFGQRAQEIPLLLLGVVARLVIQVGEVEGVFEPVDRTDRDPARSRRSPQQHVRFLGRPCTDRRSAHDRQGPRAVLIGLSAECEQPRVHDHRRDQLGARLQQLDLVLHERAGLLTLDDQHPDGHVPHDERGRHQ